MTAMVIFFYFSLYMLLINAEEHQIRHNINLSRYCRTIATELAISPETKLPIDRPGSWYFNYWEPNWSCTDERVMWFSPNTTITAGDGGKWVCDLPTLLHKPKCLVYSIGSNGEFAFEVGLLDLMDGQCEIHVFDVNTFTNHGYPEASFKQLHRHTWGIGNKNEVLSKGIVMKTLLNTMLEFGHIGRTIDILKIDIEGWEYGMLDDPRFWKEFDMSGSKVDQLLLEVHLAHYVRFGEELVSRNGTELDYLMRNLTAQGFVINHKEINQLWTLGCEFSLQRVHPNCEEFYQNHPNPSYLQVMNRHKLDMRARGSSTGSVPKKNEKTGKNGKLARLV